MYIKVIDPKTNGKNAYSNKGSSRQAANYLEGEAKKQGEKAEFFTGEKAGLSGDETVVMLDSNRKGLRADDAKFYSLVISPSEQELEHIGNDPAKLRAYTKDVMHAYAETFVLKNGEKLSEKDLVWVATQHNDRVARGTDELPSGTSKPGLQTHIHIMVSARDRQQKTTLNPLGAAARFNRVNFMAASNLIFEQKFAYQKPSLEAARPGPAGPRRAAATQQTVQQRAAEIKHRKAEKQNNPLAAGRKKREPTVPGSLTAAQLATREKRLQAQVDRINLKLSPEKQLDFTRVKEAAEKQSYDKVFYSRLGRLGREASAERPVLDPYHLLETGRLSKVAIPGAAPARSGPGPRTPRSQPIPRPQPGQKLHSKLLSGVGGMGQAMEPDTHTQDVRGEWERDE